MKTLRRRKTDDVCENAAVFATNGGETGSSAPRCPPRRRGSRPESIKHRQAEAGFQHLPKKRTWLRQETVSPASRERFDSTSSEASGHGENFRFLKAIKALFHGGRDRGRSHAENVFRSPGRTSLVRKCGGGTTPPPPTPLVNRVVGPKQAPPRLQPEDPITSRRAADWKERVTVFSTAVGGSRHDWMESCSSSASARDACFMLPLHQ